MAKEDLPCHVCGKTNTREYYTEDIGLCEDYYFCDRCGYFSCMSYSPVYEGIELFRNPLKLLRQIYYLLRNVRRLKGIKFRTLHF